MEGNEQYKYFEEFIETHVNEGTVKFEDTDKLGKIVGDWVSRKLDKYFTAVKEALRNAISDAGIDSTSIRVTLDSTAEDPFIRITSERGGAITNNTKVLLSHLENYGFRKFDKETIGVKLSVVIRDQLINR